MGPAAAGQQGYVFPDVTPYLFEKNWDEDKFQQWVHDHVHWAYIASAVYIVAIFVAQKVMSNRPKFDLRGPLILWSAALALFSVIGVIRMLMDSLVMIERGGLHHFTCTNPRNKTRQAFAAWGALFCLSKMVELGDTAFIILRKQPLIFLHWYHHITVLCFVWHSYAEHAAPGKIFMLINYTVHAVMYSYYTARALRFRMPVWLKKLVTALQLSQMFVGCSVNGYSYYLKYYNIPCRQTNDNLFYSSLMYASYLVLFAKFYYDAYIAPRVGAERDSSGTKDAGSASGRHGDSNGVGDHGNGSTVRSNGVVSSNGVSQRRVLRSMGHSSELGKGDTTAEANGKAPNGKSRNGKDKAQ